MSAVLCTGFTISDLELALPFYTNTLGCRLISDETLVGDEWDALYDLPIVQLRRVRLGLGAEQLELTQFLSHPDGRPIPANSRSHDRWFQHIAIVVSDMDAAYQHLAAHEIRPVSQGPQTLPAWNPNAGGIKAFYFLAPDGHTLELIWFPPDKGNPKWQGQTALFAGIDHTAIAVADTDAALPFYAALGLTVAGTSENYGIEQEHLNNVDGAHLRISGLAAKAGFGIEFLEYLKPRDGRPYPNPSYPHDLWHWETVIAVDHVQAVADQVVAVGGQRVSPVIEGRCLLRDIDGHAIRLVESSASDGSI